MDTTPKTLPGQAAGWEQKRPRTVPPLLEEQAKATKDRNSEKSFLFKLYANRHSYRISPYQFQNKRTEHDIALNREGYSSYGACWSNQVVHSELAPDNTGSVGPGNGPGILTPSLTNTSSIKTSSRGLPVSRSDRPDHDRGRRAETQGSNKPSPSGSRRFCLSTFPGPQEGWRFSPSNKSKSSEHIHPGGAFKNGELSYHKRTGETPGMASEGGPKGCVLSGPNPPRPPQIPPVSVARSDIPVLLPAIQSVLCSESVHKAVVAFLRERGMRLIIYLDNMLVISSSQEEAKEYVFLIRDLFGSLGLIINERKSQLEPSQEVVFLG